MQRRYRILSGLACWLLVAIIASGVIVNAHWIKILDQIGYQLVQPTTSLKTTIFTEITFWGDPVTMMIVTVGLMLFLWKKHHPTASVWYGMLQFIGYCIVLLIKYGIMRIRPVHRLINVSGYSFPSGHTFSTTIFTLTVVAILLPHLKRHWQKIGLVIIAILWILMIMVTRVYLRAHFSSDVLAGLFLAVGWWLLANSYRLTFFHWLWKPIANQLKN